MTTTDEHQVAIERAAAFVLSECLRMARLPAEHIWVDWRVAMSRGEPMRPIILMGARCFGGGSCAMSVGTAINAASVLMGGPHEIVAWRLIRASLAARQMADERAEEAAAQDA